MPFDQLEENQDEAAMLLRRFGYPLADDEEDESRVPVGVRIMRMAPSQAPPDESGALRGTDAQLQQVPQGRPQTGSTPSVGQRIVQIGNQGVPPFDIRDGKPVWRTDPQTKPSVGQKILGLTAVGAPQLESLSNVMPGRLRLNMSSPQQGPFSGFIPAGMSSPSGSGSGDEIVQRQTKGSPSEALGRSAGAAVGALAGGVLGVDQTVPAQSGSGNNTRIVTATDLTKVPSRIVRTKTASNAKPNLA